MSSKTLTRDCVSCESCVIDDDSNLLCTWGKGKRPKIMHNPKGKKAIRCNLIKDK